MAFCSTCQNLEITPTAFAVYSISDVDQKLRRPICALGRLHDIQGRCQKCPLCKLIFAVFRGGSVRRLAAVADLKSTALYAKWICPLGLERRNRSRTPTLYILVWAESSHFAPGSYKISIRAASTLSPNQPYLSRISRRSILDFEELKGWLTHCEESHSSCNTSHVLEKPTTHFFLVDTRDKCIVRPKTHCRYIALSYVWGGVPQHKLTEDNLQELSADFSLRPELLAATIRDAVELTEKLGERYLWVDTLCLIQDSTAIRQQTLQDMDRIFAQSLLTIVAGSCSTANDPLPGVSQGRAWTPWYQEVSSLALTLSAHFDFKDVLEDAIYNQRAWTFQEYQVANRLLIFAPNGQVYFSCKESVHSEDIVPSANLDADVAMLQGAQSIKIQPTPVNVWSTYRYTVERYSKKSLTHQEDALDAFSGILRTIVGTRCVEGLPASMFDKALLWQPVGRLPRRDCFASWSWVGWTGKVHWLRNDNPKTEDIETNLRTWIVWYCTSKVNCDTSAFLVNGPPRLQCSRSIESARSNLFTGSPRNYLPTPTLLPRRLQYCTTSQQDLRFLQFWTFSVQAEIALDSLSVIRNRSLQAENTGNGLRKFHILGKNTQYCGWVQLDEDWIEAVTNGSGSVQEFILLSEVDSHDIRSDGNAFNAMMIIWRNGIAERAGLGQILDEAVGNVDLEWKEILLA